MFMDLRADVFISHNLSVVDHIAKRVAVMYLGRVVELASTSALFRQPRNPYTQALISSILTPEPSLGILHIGLGLSFPDPLNPPGGCVFHPRCPRATDICRTVKPRLSTACHLHNTEEIQ